MAKEGSEGVPWRRSDLRHLQQGGRQPHFLPGRPGESARKCENPAAFLKIMRSNHHPAGPGARWGECRCVAEEHTPGVTQGSGRRGATDRLGPAAARALPSTGVDSHLAGRTAVNFVLGVISNFLTAASTLFHMREKQIPGLVWSDEFRTREIQLDFMALIIILRTAAGDWWPA